MTEQSSARRLFSELGGKLGEDAAMEIGELIRLKRKEGGLTQRSLAALLGVNHTAVHQWEQSLTLPTNANMAALKAVLGIGETIHASANTPYSGELVDDPDELAWLGFWRSLTNERKVMVTDLLRVGVPLRKAV